jgi:subtilase family serine protease
MSDADIPKTLSISYGDDEQTIPLSYATGVCNLFMQLGARGVSVMISSGDSGPGGQCISNKDNKTPVFLPAFPVNCPYVTAVGATQNIPERAASFSGGGFSNYFPRPAYQDAAVSGFLANNKQFQQYYNVSGRAYPDVSAQGVNYLVVSAGTTNPVDGTSASSPTFASIIALLNSARLSTGLTTLGFLNPFLYGAGVAGLNDITVGKSTGCSGQIPGANFPAVAGWDPATGLGTPDFGKLLAIAAPKACNVGGTVPNPSISSCKGGAVPTATTSSAVSSSTSVSAAVSSSTDAGAASSTDSAPASASATDVASSTGGGFATSTDGSFATSTDAGSVPTGFTTGTGGGSFPTGFFTMRK